MGELKANWAAPEIIRSQLTEISRLASLAEMASGLAHELNQPLGAIATFSQAGDRLLNRAEPQVARAMNVFRQISQEALDAGDTIKRIRSLYNEVFSMDQPCQIPDLIGEIRPILDALLLPLGGTLQIEASPALPEVRVDRLRIQHVLLALVQNAVEAGAGDAQAPLVKIDVSANQYAVETGVSDSGIRVPTHLRSKLFQPFFTTKPRGKGLGLASSRAIVESLQGTIGFDDCSTSGSRVWFRLPVLTAD